MEYQERYQSLKKKLKALLYEQDSFQKELEKSQVKLLRVSRDKTFLLDRLLLYEQVSEDSLDDSDATLSSDNEVGLPARKKNNTGGVVTIKQSQEMENEKSIQTSVKGDELSGDKQLNAALPQACLIKQETPDQQRLPVKAGEDDSSKPG